MYENLLNPNEFSSISGVSKQTYFFTKRKMYLNRYLKMKKDSDFNSLEQLDNYSNYTGLTDNRLVSQRNSELYRKQKRQT